MVNTLKNEEFTIVDDNYVALKKQTQKNIKRTKQKEPEEYKILEDEQDKMERELRQTLENIVQEMEKEEEKERKNGPLCGVMSEIRFIQDNMGNNALFFAQPAEDYVLTGNVMKSVVYANMTNEIDKEFNYQSFQGFIMLHLMKHRATKYNVNDLLDVYAFLKSDIHKHATNKPSIDLLFRENEKMQRVDVYADVRLNNKKIEEEIPFSHLNLYCKHLNEALNRKNDKSGKSFGGNEK